MPEIEFHPLADLFPLLDGAAFNELVADIKANGLKVPITTHGGKIVDGRNRYRACLAADVDPHYRVWDGNGTLLGFVISMNLCRRHLDESQRAMVAAKIANVPQGVTIAKVGRSQDVADQPHPEFVTRAEAAKMMNVGEKLVATARRIRAKGDPSVVEAVESGKMAVTAAEQVIKKPVEEQKRIAAAARVVKGRRLSVPAPKPQPTRGSAVPEAKEIKIAINTNEPASAAAMLAERLEPAFLEKLTDALTSIIHRRKVARERGLGPVAKG